MGGWGWGRVLGGGGGGLGVGGVRCVGGWVDGWGVGGGCRGFFVFLVGGVEMVFASFIALL